MALEEEQFLYVPGVIDLESAGNGLFEIGDVAATRIFEAGESEVRFERPVFRWFANSVRRGRDFALKRSRLEKVALEASPENAWPMNVWEGAECLAGERKWRVRRADRWEKLHEFFRLRGGDPAKKPEGDMNLVRLHPAEGAAAKF